MVRNSSRTSSSVYVKHKVEMKKLVITAEKGGVGKTALNCQLALYLALKLKRRVLFLDFDLQNNATSTLTAQGAVSMADYSVHDLLTRPVGKLPVTSFVLVPEGERKTLGLFDQGDKDTFLSNLVTFFDQVDTQFDICIMDTPPTPVITHNLPLVTADYLLAPLTLSQESIDGIEAILFSKPWGFKNIKANFNRDLEFLGILAVMVQSRPDQAALIAFLEQEESTKNILFKLDDGTTAQVPSLAAVRIAQGQGYFLGDLKTSSARDAWRRIKPTFDTIVSRLELEKTA
jgi:chromosome partitioning protein